MSMVDPTWTLREAEAHAELSVKLSRLVRDAVEDGDIPNALSILNDAAAPEYFAVTTRTKALLEKMQHVEASYGYATRKLKAAEQAEKEAK